MCPPSIDASDTEHETYINFMKLVAVVLIGVSIAVILISMAAILGSVTGA